MQFIELVVCISALVTKICFAGLITETSQLDESSLIEASITLLESCYTDRFSTVGVAGPSIGNIMTAISSRDTVIPVTLVDETSRVESHDPVDRGSQYKLQVFVITVTNSSTLVKTLSQVKRSSWWNHMASFLLIDLPIAENGCSNAVESLLEAWKMNLLNSKFVCLHRTRGRLIYTFNPYTSKAPIPWQQENTYKGPDGHIWTLFVREYSEHALRCDGLDFDKTVDLGGYEIRASVRGMENWWSVDPDVKLYLDNRVYNVTAQILISSLNATWKLLAAPLDRAPLIDSETGETYGVAAEVTSGISDICLNIIAPHVYGNFQTTYPLNSDQVVIITHYPGYKSQFDKFISVLDRSSLFGVLVVLIITLFFSKFWLRKPLILATLDIVLIVCNAAFHKIPDKLAPRIYLCSLFIFVVTIQGIYQGQLASLLTKAVRLRPINNIEDLARSKLPIYAPEEYRFLFTQSALQKRYYSAYNCEDLIMYNPYIACVGSVSEVSDVAAQFNLHLSRQPIGVTSGAYLIRTDWPLEERVNLIYGRAAAGGIAETLYSRQRDSLMNTLESYETEDQESGPKVITMEQLRFAFIILGIGLTCATVTFIIEVAIFDTAIANPRRHTRR